MSDAPVSPAIHFSDYYKVDPASLVTYGAFDISLLSDLPLFIDPFLLFNSPKAEYQELHKSIIKYLLFLRDKSLAGSVHQGLLKSWYHFKEVKQNWLGFTVLGNDGHALGPDFANSLNKNLGRLFEDQEQGTGQPITEGRHLEKVSLIKEGVGRDGISDFTTNLIKKHLLEYTQKFARDHLAAADRQVFAVKKVWFNYETESWVPESFELPKLGDDFVLLTPIDMLTRDDTWISRKDLIAQFSQIPEAITDSELRAQVNNYFEGQLKTSNPKKGPTQKERTTAAAQTIDRFPQILDYYIALKELDRDAATSISSERVAETDHVFVERLKLLLADMVQHSQLVGEPVSSYDEALKRVRAFKNYIENQDGYKLVNPGDRDPYTEKEIQLLFGLAMVGTSFDFNREPNNGRGPVDGKISKGAYDKSLIEFKLGSNTQLKRNLQNQVEIYAKANETKKAVKVIVNFTAAHTQRVSAILKELGLDGKEDVIVIDARSDNKPTGSKA
jgi:hypothetical protein